jgi:phage-related minor tail protein
MAAEIIAKQMTMIILQTILRALGAVGGGGGGGFSGNAAGFGGSFDAGIPSIGNTTNFAGVFGRADGGPTAAGTPYLVGERGPELFVPGSNGGVMSNNDLRSAMNSQGSGGAGSPVLNMSFESTTIGGVEYVSRDQLEQAMAETRRAASRDGAQRGMTMTLDRIQNSSSTRRRVGI